MKLTDAKILQALREHRIVRRKDWAGAHLAVGIANKLKVVWLNWANKQKTQALSLPDLAADDWQVAE